jgi:hypothetical protein
MRGVISRIRKSRNLRDGLRDSPGFSAVRSWNNHPFTVKSSFQKQDQVVLIASGPLQA